MAGKGKEVDKEQEDPPEVVVERMTNALKRALKTPPKPHKPKDETGERPRGRPKKAG